MGARAKQRLVFFSVVVNDIFLNFSFSIGLLLPCGNKIDF